MGSVKVEPGTEWKEQRIVESVVEKWPNGNIKAKGQKVNGKAYGKWEYFSEEGDRTKTVEYNRGVTMEHYPDHPDNKGAGKPKR
jgi:antitoxin component YwqK of YwqJK toxin-antitoxin module